MGGEDVEREERRGKKKKDKLQEGEEKAGSSRHGYGRAVERDLADVPINSEEKEKEKAVMNAEEAKDGHKGKKEKGRGKEKKNKDINGLADSSATVAGAEKEQVKASGLTVEQRCSEHVEGDMSKCDMKDMNIRKDKKLMKKKKERKAEMTGNEQALGSADENVCLENAEMDKGEKKQATKSKKSKRKHVDGEPAADGSAGDLTNRDNKKRRKEYSVKLDEGDRVNIPKMGVKIEENKKRRNENDKFNPDLSHNTLTRGDEAREDGKNDKKKKKSKEGSGLTRGDEAREDGKNDKKKKKRKEGSGGGKSEKERAARSKDKVRRVSFADDVEVFSINGGEDEENDKSCESKVVHGKRFSPEENATLMEAIKNYAEMKQLGEKGLEMIRASSKYPELKGCWAEIAKSLPHRPLNAIYKRARILLYMSDERKWTQEEYEKIRRHVEKNGTSWISLAQELGKSEIHLKDTWRRIKPKNLKAGPWTQDEYQNLFDLVNLDLRVKAHQEYDAGNRQLRDNIAWEAISEKLTTRNHKNCCIKWYYQLASPLVQKGLWADTDDYRLVEALQNVDAVCIEDVDWDSLLDHRSGEICRTRWNELVRNIGGHKEKPFIEQVEVLSKRYCPEMLDYRK